MPLLSLLINFMLNISINFLKKKTDLKLVHSMYIVIAANITMQSGIQLLCLSFSQNLKMHFFGVINNGPFILQKQLE